jgi:hypothetical protein
MERDQLAKLLDQTDGTARACRAALLDGADYKLWEGTTPASRMVPAYERRQTQTIASGASTMGFADALVTLRGAGVADIRLGQVTAVNPPYVFMVFLAEDSTSVVGCFGIGQSQAN